MVENRVFYVFILQKFRKLSVIQLQNMQRLDLRLRHLLFLVKL